MFIYVPILSLVAISFFCCFGQLQCYAVNVSRRANERDTMSHGDTETEQNKHGGTGMVVAVGNGIFSATETFTKIDCKPRCFVTACFDQHLRYASGQGVGTFWCWCGSMPSHSDLQF